MQNAKIHKYVRRLIHQVGEKNIFEFNGSKHFLDYLRKDGPESIDKYLAPEEKRSSWKKAITIGIANQEHKRNTEQAGCGSPRALNGQQKGTKVMKEDREYLKQLEMELLSEPHADMVKHSNKSNILKTVKRANAYLQEREMFWMYFD